MHYPFLIILGAAGLFFGLANPLYHFPPAVLLYPAALYLIGTTSGQKSLSFRRGMLTGMIGAAAVLYWVAVPMHNDAGLSWPLAAPAPLLLGACLGVYSGLFSLSVHWCQTKLPNILLLAFATSCWALLEYVCSFLFSGFPWLSISVAFGPWPVVLQPVAYIGSFVFSGLLAGLACAAASFCRMPSKAAAAWCAGTVLLIATVGYFHWQTPITTVQPLRINLIQGNIDQGQKWIPAYQNGTVSRYITLSTQSLRRYPADLVVWPETAMPFYLQEHREYQPRIRLLAKKTNVPLLAGSPGYTAGTNGQKWDIFNRAYLVTPDTPVEKYYDKEHLVPFGEYIPLNLSIPFLDAFFDGSGAFVPGQRTAPIEYGSVALGVLICYETIFPELAQNRVAQGANILINISNDAWFGNTSAPYQHLYQSVLRAIEQERYVARATNTGISAIISPKGQVISRGGLFRADIIHGEAKLIQATSWYHNNYFAILIFIIFMPVLLLGLAWRNSIKNIRI